MRPPRTSLKHRWPIVALALSLCAGLVAPAFSATSTFADELWDANRDLYQQILAHPFLREMVKGTLDRRTFAAYLIQDAYYLTEFAAALRAVAAHAPKPEWAALLERHAQDSLTEETRLHRRVLGEYGISVEDMARTEPSPDAFAYTSYIVATAHRAPFGEAVAALLPCYWIYREVGRDLKKQGTPEATYREWIEAYSSPEYSQSVDAVVGIVNEVASQADETERVKMRARFRRGFQYEWMFWEAAYHPRPWPGEGEKRF